MPCLTSGRRKTDPVPPTPIIRGARIYVSPNCANRLSLFLEATRPRYAKARRIYLCVAAPCRCPGCAATVEIYREDRCVKGLDGPLRANVE